MSGYHVADDGLKYALLLAEERFTDFWLVAGYRGTRGNPFHGKWEVTKYCAEGSTGRGAGVAELYHGSARAGFARVANRNVT